MSYLFTGILLGIAVGYFLFDFLSKRKETIRKKSLAARKKVRQRSIHERFRIEVKNNVIRLKKEQKKLAAAGEPFPIELLFKNFRKRLGKVADKDLKEDLYEFYEDLLAVDAANKIYVQLFEKKIGKDSGLPEDVSASLREHIVSTLLKQMTNTEEKGAGLVKGLEEKIRAA